MKEQNGMDKGGQVRHMWSISTPPMGPIAYIER